MVGVGILVILAAVAAGVFHTQHTFHAPVNLGRSLPAPTPESVPAAGQPAEDAVIAADLPPGFQGIGPGESFTPATLSEKIDGKAELYLSSGFQGLRTRRFAPDGDHDWWAEMFVYEMGGAAEAFTVFSQQRRDSAEPSDVSSQAYRTENALFFVHGSYYVEVVASAASEAVRQALENTARLFVEGTPVGKEPAQPNVSDLFPEQGRIGQSVERIGSDAFGFDRLDDVYTARYATEAGEQTLFLSRRTSGEEAAALVEAYVDFLVRFGGKRLPAAAGSDGRDATLVEILGVTEAVFSHGIHFAGVHEAPSPDAAADLARMLRRSLEANAP